MALVDWLGLDDDIRGLVASTYGRSQSVQAMVDGHQDALDMITELAGKETSSIDIEEASGRLWGGSHSPGHRARELASGW